MKNPLLILSVPILGAAAFLAWQYLPANRYAKHMIKARLYVQENHLMAAREEYEIAHNARGQYTPYVSLEVLEITNLIHLTDNSPQEAFKNTRAFVRENPESKEGKIILARLAFRIGEADAGFEAIDDLLEIDPWYFPARLLLATTCAEQGRLNLAEEQLRFLFARYPDSLHAYLPLAESLINQGRYPESRVYLGRLLAREPGNHHARLILADSYLKEGKPDSAQPLLGDSTESDPVRLQELRIRKARAFLLQERMDDAVRALSPYTGKKAENIMALYELAVVYTGAGKLDSAITVYKYMGDIDPEEHAWAETLLYYLYMKNQNPARALEAMKSLQIADKSEALMRPLIAAYVAIDQDYKATALIGQQPDSLRKPLTEFMSLLLPDKEFIGQWALLSFYGLNGVEALAYRAARDLHKRWPESPLAIDLYADRLARAGEFAKAAVVLGALKTPSLAHQTALLKLLVLTRQGGKAQAQSLAEKLSREHPEIPDVHAVLGDYWIKKDKEKALAYYKKELTLNPDNLEVLSSLAREYGINQTDLEKAAPYLDKLKAKKSLDPRILDTIGWILACNGKQAEGEKHIRTALELVPDDPAFRYHLAYVLFQTGKREEGRKHLDSALATDRPFEERKGAEKLLSQFR